MKFLNKLLLTLMLVILCFGQGVSARDIKFIQISDSHFSSINGAGYSQGVLEKTIKDINTIPDVDFVVFTGDNIDTANSTDLIKFLKIANHLKYPYYVVIGNHEVFKSQHFDKKDYMKIVKKYSKNCRSKSANYVFKKKGVVFLVVDGAKEVIPGPAGYYKKDTLKWLNKKLTKYEKDNVIIFQHFPIVPPYYNRTHSTYEVEKYQDLLKKHSNVVGIFSGHYHANGEIQQDGIYHVSTPSLLAPPNNYKVIDVSIKGKKDCQIYTQLRKAEDL